MSYPCEFCDKKLSSKSSLSTHLKRAQYCINNRKKTTIEVFIFECSGCDKVYTSKQNLNIHMETCVKFQIKLDTEKNKTHIEMLDNQILELKNKVSELEGRLENVAIKAVSRSTTTNQTHINNYIQKLELTTDEYIKEQVPLLTIEHIKRGVEGYAEYALKHPLNNRLICVDYSRRKVKYKDKNGDIITDPEMSKITMKLFESIKSRNKELIRDFVMESRDTIAPEVQMDMIADMGDYIAMVNRGAVGDKTELYHDFVKNICSHSVV